ncbi:MAG: DUF2066 domain-containing protein [Paracoccaceae bacterium]
MRMLTHLFGAGLALLVAGPTASAIEIPGLYTGRAIITGTQDPELTRGLRAALEDVVIKLTGDARPETRPLYAPILEQPRAFLDDMTLEDRMKGIPVHDEQGTRERPHVLTATFASGPLEAAITGAGLDVWALDRPLVAVWLGVDTGTGRFVITEDGTEGYGQRLALMDTAERRGLPVRLPRQAEAAAVPFRELLRRDAASLALPGADAILSGVLTLTEGGYWNIEWTLAHADQADVLAVEDVSFDVAIRQGIEGMALQLSGDAAAR